MSVWLILESGVKNAAGRSDPPLFSVVHLRFDELCAVIPFGQWEVSSQGNLRVTDPSEAVFKHAHAQRKYDPRPVSIIIIILVEGEWVEFGTRFQIAFKHCTIRNFALQHADFLTHALSCCWRCGAMMNRPTDVILGKITTLQELPLYLVLLQVAFDFVLMSRFVCSSGKVGEDAFKIVSAYEYLLNDVTFTLWSCLICWKADAKENACLITLVGCLLNVCATLMQPFGRSFSLVLLIHYTFFCATA